MRTTCCLLLAFGLNILCSTSARAQSSDGTWRPANHLLIKSNPNSQSPEAPPVPRSSPTGAFETRGVVYFEEQQGPGSPPKIVTPPKAPLTFPTATPKPILKTTAAVPVVTTPSQSPAMPSVIARPISSGQDDVLRQRVQRQIADKCPQARNVRITFNAAKEVTIEMDARSMPEANALAEHIFAIRELDPYRINLKCTVPQP